MSWSGCRRPSEPPTLTRTGSRAHRQWRQIPAEAGFLRVMFRVGSIPPLMFSAPLLWVMDRSRRGTPISPRNLVRQFKDLLTDAELPGKIRFHDLRHTAATWALVNGLDFSTVMEMLGHSQASTTLNFYAHALKESRRVAVNDAVNKAFGGVVTTHPGHQEGITPP